MILDTINVFLEKFRSKPSTNTSEGLHVSLTGKKKLLPVNDTSNVLSQNDQYNKERENCSVIRLTCQVNPVCSNVLFNRISEIVKDEGSQDVSFINYGVGNINVKGKGIDFWGGGTFSYDGNTVTSTNRHPTNSIRDTQLSNKDNNYVYHCGIDILNNHLIRSNTFKTVCAYQNNNEAANTIADMMRKVDGTFVNEKIAFPPNVGVPGNEKDVNLHLYEIDDILTFKETINERLIKEYNGWVGFNNRSKMKSYNHSFISGNSLEIEKPLMYYSGGDFIDMCPDRSLYSFVPKYNKYRHRIEKNWNYCITYPSSSYTPSNDSEPFSEVIDYELKSMKVVCFNENTRQDNGTRQLVIYSVAKHGLEPGDYVNIYKRNSSGEVEKILDNAEVTAIADDFIFTLFTQDVQISKKWTTIDNLPSGYTIDGKYVTNGSSYYKIVGDNISNYVNIDDDAQDISYKKVVNDIECDYYVRIFSRLPNFKFASGDTSNEYEIYRDRGGYNMVDFYSDQKYDFESHVSRLAFAKNIYTDEIGEIVFTDDIDIANIKDNLGRPLSELYLTIIKNNSGYKEWYGFNNVPISIGSEKVEFSHCFGKVKCGIEMNYMCNDEHYTNNINRLTYSSQVVVNNEPRSAGYDVGFINQGRDAAVEIDEVSFNDDIHYYGDISCFDNYNSIERHLQPVMQRVNTAQRESVNSSSNQYFSSYVYDEIIHDDYDINEEYTITSYTINGANSHNEGYYYIPHYQIPIRTFGLLNTVMPDFLKMRSLIWYNDDGVVKISTLQNHHFTMGDKAVIYDKKHRKYYYCVIVDGSNITKKPDSPKVFTCKIYDKYGNPAKSNKESGIPNLITGMTETQEDNGFGNITDYSLFKLDNINAPSYARVLEDGTCRVIWRDILNNGFAINNEEVEEYPFTNGAFYIHKRVDLYLRRQDPHDLYGLYSEDDIEGVDVDITNEDNYYNEDEVEC